VYLLLLILVDGNWNDGYYLHFANAYPTSCRLPIIDFAAAQFYAFLKVKKSSAENIM